MERRRKKHTHTHEKKDTGSWRLESAREREGGGRSESREEANEKLRSPLAERPGERLSFWDVFSLGALQ